MPEPYYPGIDYNPIFEPAPTYNEFWEPRDLPSGVTTYPASRPAPPSTPPQWGPNQFAPVYRPPYTYNDPYGTATPGNVNIPGPPGGYPTAPGEEPPVLPAAPYTNQDVPGVALSPADRANMYNLTPLTPGLLEEMGLPTDWAGAGQFFMDAAGNIVDAVGNIVKAAGDLAGRAGQSIINFLEQPGYSSPEYLRDIGYREGSGYGSLWPASTFAPAGFQGGRSIGGYGVRGGGGSYFHGGGGGPLAGSFGYYGLGGGGPIMGGPSSGPIRAGQGPYGRGFAYGTGIGGKGGTAGTRAALGMR